MKKLISLLLALVMTVSLGAAAFAEEAGAEGESVTILYTNDIHGYIDQGLNYALTAEYRDTLDNVLLVDAGDHLQGTVYGALDQGRSIIGIMNAMKYDLATLGNHEFDYGMEGCLNAIEWAEFPYVSCNFYHVEDGLKGDTVLDAYKVFEIGGKKIAFIGVTTPESIRKSTPVYFQDEEGNYIYDVAGGEDGSELYEAVQKAIDAASAEADVVIALGHLGVDPSSVPWTSREVIANTTGLDAFIDGHSHTEIPMEEVADAEGNPVILTQTGCYFSHLGQMTIAPDGSIATEILSAADVKAALYDHYIDAIKAGELTPDQFDETVAGLQDSWIAEVGEELGEVIGTFDDVMDNYDADGNRLVRKQETNSGDFAADAFYWLFENMGLDVDVVILNGGGLRNTAVTGEISYLTCKEMLPFGNVACLVEATGQQIIDALEFGARGVGTEEEIGGFMQVAGIRYTIDSSIPSPCTVDEIGSFVSVDGERKVSNVEVFNRETGEYEPMDPERVYNLAGYSHILRNQGSGNTMLADVVNVLDYVMEDYMVLANYVQSFEDTDGDGLPNVSGYPDVNGDGRIIIK